MKEAKEIVESIHLIRCSTCHAAISQEITLRFDQIVQEIL